MAGAGETDEGAQHTEEAGTGLALALEKEESEEGEVPVNLFP